MKSRKLISIILAVSVMAAASGCSGYKTVTCDDFIDGCEQLGAEQIDMDDLRNLEADDFEDGFYLSVDFDEIEEEAGEYALAIVKAGKLDLGIDFDDIEDFSVYVRMDPGADYWEELLDHGPESVDADDYELDFVIAMQISLSEEYEVDEIMDGIDDLFGQIDIDMDDLSKKEWNYNANNGYLKIHVDIADLSEAFMESYAFELIQENNNDVDYEELMENRTGDIGLAFYVSPDNIFVVLGINSNQDPNRLTELCDVLHIGNPVDLPSNSEVVDSTVNYFDRYARLLFGSLNSYLERAREASEAIQETQEDG